MKRRTMAFGGLLMAVAITGYSVAGTYAKYISTFDMADQARVAKWDFTNKAENTVDLFQESYSTNENGVYVASADGAKVVAPGTEGSYKYEITGTAETNFKVSRNIKIVNRIALVGDYKIEDGSEGDWEKGKVYYNPIEFSTDGGNTWFKATTPEYKDGKFVGLTYEVKATDATIYPANHVLTNEATGEIQWRWTFEQTTVQNNDLESYDNDTLDTILASMVDDKNLTMNATIGVVVEQTQDAPTAKVEGTTLTSKAPLMTITNRISAADLKEYETEVGYDATNSREVVFNGSALTGTIYKTTNAYADRFMGASNTGYYYLLNVKSTDENAAKVRVTGKTTSTFALDGNLTVMVGLQDSVDTIKFEILDSSNNVLSTKSIDVKLTFAN